MSSPATIGIELAEGAPESIRAELRQISGVEVSTRTTLNSTNPIPILLFVFHIGRQLGEVLGWLQKAPEVVSLYLSSPVGAVIGGAVAGKLVEKIIDVVVRWGHHRANQRNRPVEIVLYGPDGRTIITKQFIDPSANPPTAPRISSEKRIQH